MRKDSFTDFIKNKLDIYESPMDTSRGWNDLKRRKKNDRRAVWLWSLLILVLVSTTLIYVKTDAPTANQSPKTFAQSEQPKDIAQTQSHTSTNHPSQTQDAHNTPPQYSVKTTRFDTLNLIQSNLSEQTAFKTAVANTNLPKNQANPSSQNSQTETLQATNSEQPVVSNNWVTKTPPPFEKTPNSADSAKTAFVDLASIHKPLSPLWIEKDTLQGKLTVAIPIQPLKKPSKNYEIYLNTGIGRTHQRFEAKDTTAISLQKFRNEHETALETYYTEGGVKRYLSSKTYVGLGISYAQGYNRFDYTQVENKNLTLTNVVVRIITYQPIGNVQEIRGDTIVTQTITTTGRYYQTYSNVNLGVNFGYKWLEKAHLTMAINGGLSWSLFANAKGKAVNQSIGAALTDIATSNIYKKTFGLGAFVGLDAQYQLNSRIAFCMSPSFHYGISNITQNDYALKARIYRYGLSVGLKYIL